MPRIISLELLTEPRDYGGGMVAALIKIDDWPPRAVTAGVRVSTVVRLLGTIEALLRLRRGRAYRGARLDDEVAPAVGEAVLGDRMRDIDYDALGYKGLIREPPALCRSFSAI